MAHRTLLNSSSLLLSPKPSTVFVTWLLLVHCSELAMESARLLSCCQSLKQMPKLILALFQMICQRAKLVLGLPFPFILMGNLESSHQSIKCCSGDGKGEKQEMLLPVAHRPKSKVINFPVSPSNQQSYKCAFYTFFLTTEGKLKCISISWLREQIF